MSTTKIITGEFVDNDGNGVEYHVAVNESDSEELINSQIDQAIDTWNNRNNNSGAES
jgi:hypothetical protein